MKISKVQTLLLGLSILLAISCGRSDPDATTLQSLNLAVVKPLEKKSSRETFCGAESYNSRADSACGVKAYKVAESAACGVSLYKSQADRSCPGYRPESEPGYTGSGSHSCSIQPAACPAGQEDHGITWNRVSPPICHRNHGEGCENSEDSCTPFRKCIEPEHIESCRKPEWGVERYKSCEHANHGAASYKTCALPQFGINSYKVCPYYLTPNEITVYLNTKTADDIEINGVNMIDRKGDFLIETKQEEQAACLIKRFDNNILYKTVVEELKTNFYTSFLKNFDESEYSCNGSPTSDISTYDCPEGNTLRLCRLQIVYKYSKSWLEVLKIDLANLLTDLPAAQNAATKAELTRSNIKLDEVIKQTGEFENVR